MLEWRLRRRRGEEVGDVTDSQPKFPTGRLGGLGTGLQDRKPVHAQTPAHRIMQSCNCGVISPFSKRTWGRAVMIFEWMCFGVLLLRDCFNDVIVFELGDIEEKLYRCQLFCRGGARARACGHTMLTL